MTSKPTTKKEQKTWLESYLEENDGSTDFTIYDITTFAKKLIEVLNKDEDTKEGQYGYIDDYGSLNLGVVGVEEAIKELGIDI